MQHIGTCHHLIVIKLSLMSQRSVSAMPSDSTSTILPLRRSRRLRNRNTQAAPHSGKRQRAAGVDMKEEVLQIKVEDQLIDSKQEHVLMKEKEEVVRNVNIKKEAEGEMVITGEAAMVDTKVEYSGKKRRNRSVQDRVSAKWEVGRTDDVEECCLPKSEDVEEIIERLGQMYGTREQKSEHPKTKPKESVLDSLVATILSQSTTNINSSRAFQSLKQAFPTWEDALQANPKDIEKSIRAGGLAQVKAERIHAILKALQKQRGKLDLEYIREMDDEQAKEFLCAFQGVGPKTASCVLMFNMGRGEFPVDTHVKRLTARFGWIPDSYSREKAYEELNKVLDKRHKYSLHVLLVTHGRRTCRPSNPKCDICPLADKCRYARMNLDENMCLSRTVEEL